MPYQLPGDRPADDADEQLVDVYRDRVQEREVRHTAQRILTTNLRPGDRTNPRDTQWENIDLDLTAATLIDFDLSGCTIQTALFTSATFTGPADFEAVTFTGPASFRSATFTGSADFQSASFTDRTEFELSSFTELAYFGSASFTDWANFQQTTFSAEANFSNASFDGLADFQSATFTGPADFEAVTFTGPASFRSATFTVGEPAEIAEFLPSATEEPPVSEESPTG